ncbi:MAG: DUF2784 domain-containing protein [Spirochaetales bacterium]|nr:DUF2784 domain-containing protein [Spirochaetales bacterium]
MNPYAFLADLVVFFHFLYVSFAVGGELVILLGWIFRWSWVRNMAFRVTHLCAVVLVAVEALSGILCPLTEWEYNLRMKAGQRVDADMTFVARLIRKIIFYDFPPWVFTVMYVGFAALVVMTFLLVRPRRKE